MKFDGVVGITAGLLIFTWGCAPKEKMISPGPQTPPPLTKPVFDRTFGDLTVGEGATLLIQYKGMNILIDPMFIPDNADNLDYLIFTGGFLPESFKTLRKNLKIVCPKSEEKPIQSLGFSQVKGIAPGSRIMFQKNGGFLFVSVLENRFGAQPGTAGNSYILEFDNGRNIFVAGDALEPGSLKLNIYQLRDDGKEIHFGFFHGEPGQEEKVAQMVAMLQPKIGFITPQTSAMELKLSSDKFQTRLKEELFDGFIVNPKAGEKYPF